MAGPTQAPLFADLASRLYQANNQLRKERGFGPIPPTKWLSPIPYGTLAWLARFSKKTRGFAKVSKLLSDYLTLQRVYDDQQARTLLDPAGIVPPAFQEYVTNLVTPFASLVFSELEQRTHSE